MTASLLERLRAALAPHYSVERELASGGMGTVFLGRDQGLDRPVAIKLLRPEIATAEHAERFLREARILARLSHPNIVPIHQVGETDGLFYYVMDYLTGETLYQRLTRGTLSPAEATSLALDLLSALAAAHHQGVVHRDLKPGNILLVEGRAVLTDFGVAKSLNPTDITLSHTDTRPGTLSYMAPEQLTGAAVSPRTDLYALGIVLFEALTDRRWWIRDQQAQTDWSGVPRRLERVLRKALAWSPEGRWGSAAEMREALTRRRQVPGVVLAALILALAVWFGVKHRQPTPMPHTSTEGLVAILPVEANPGLDTVISEDLTLLMQAELEEVLPLLSDRQVFHLAREIAADSGRSLGLRAMVKGRLAGTPSALQLQLTIIQPGHDPQRLTVDGDTASRDSMSYKATQQILFALVPELHDFNPAKGFSRNPRAMAAFVEGLRDFREDRWMEAQRAFEGALAIDSNFAMGSWRLVNVRRWRRVPFGIDVGKLYREHRDEFGDRDQLLIRAQTESDLMKRFTDYATAVHGYAYDGYAALLYADELFHRGPLAGLPLKQAVNMFETAVQVDSLLAPAYDHIIWGYARLGDSAAAYDAFQRMRPVVSTPTGPGDLDMKSLMRLVLKERFEPDSGLAFNGWSDSAKVSDLIQTFRWGVSFDIPRAQLKYGRAIASRVPFPQVRASGHNGEGIALIALGRPREALAQFDSAYRILDTPASDLLRAEWRVLPAALGLLPPDAKEQARGRAILRGYRGDPLGFRADWALAIDALMRGDSISAMKHAARVRERARSNRYAQRLDSLYRALVAGERGNDREALSLSLPLLEWDSAGQGGDPFYRSILHLSRGEWWNRDGFSFQASREWNWYQNTDLEGWPTGEVQAGEVDWSFGTLARYWQARTRLSSGHVTEACGELRRVAELWHDAEPAMHAVADSAAMLAAAHRCSS